MGQHTDISHIYRIGASHSCWIWWHCAKCRVKCSLRCRFCDIFLRGNHFRLMGYALITDTKGLQHAISIKPVLIAKGSYFMLRGSIAIKSTSQVYRPHTRDLCLTAVTVLLHRLVSTQPGALFQCSMKLMVVRVCTVYAQRPAQSRQWKGHQTRSDS